jgi:aspartyl-tRNA(Asn)/glutamyl-tRNA(Gln) amidotransferase subunit B
MEKGSLRADVNVSVRKPGGPLGTRCEIKNMNSISFIGDAIEYEARRQIEIIEDGGVIDQETRLYDPNKGETRSMRSKEEAHDYRYFPEPDLPPLIVSDAWRREILTAMPELPEARRARMVREYEISERDAQSLTATREFADTFEAAAKRAKNPRRVANLVQSELMGRLRAAGIELDRSPVTMDGVVLAADLAEEGKLSSKQWKQIFDIAFEKREDFGVVYEREKPQQISDTATLEKMIDEVIAANPKQVEQYRGGKKTVAAFFVGQVMRASKGQANPALLNELVTKKLDA